MALFDSMVVVLVKDFVFAAELVMIMIVKAVVVAVVVMIVTGVIAVLSW